MKLKNFFILIFITFLFFAENALASITLYDGMPSGILPAGTTAATISLHTDPSAIICRYATEPNVPISSMENEFGPRGTSFFYTTVYGLTNGNTYSFFVKCYNSESTSSDYEITFSVANDPQPSISSISKNIYSGENISIMGNNFGVKTRPEPLIWDDFENGVSMENLMDHSNWEKNAGTGAKYTEEVSYSGSLSAFNRIVAADGSPTSFYTNHMEVPLSEKLYGSYMFYYKVSGNPSCVLKLSRFASNYDGPLFHTDWYNGPGNTAWYASRSDCTQGGIAASFDSGLNVTQRYFGDISTDKWQRFEMYKKLSTPGLMDGDVISWVDSKTTERQFNVLTRDEGFDYELQFFTLGLMLANPKEDGIFSLFIDDVYVDNTLARIEICNGPDWELVRSGGYHCEVQVPHTQWEDQALQIKINQGSFDDGELTYLYIIDSNGNVNLDGFPVKFMKLEEVASVPNVTNDQTPQYIFNSTEVGDIIYGGLCDSAIKTSSTGDNSINLSILAPGEYADCTISISDTLGYTSVPLKMSPFVVTYKSDLNLTRNVDIFDYNILLGNFGAQSDCQNQADTNEDCEVNIFDYNNLLADFGKSV